MTAPAPVPEADVVAADLPTIPLADGTRVPVEAGMANVWLVEKRYGSIGGLYRTLGAMGAESGETVEQAMFRVMIGPLIEALACFMPRGPLRDAGELAEHLAAKDTEQFCAALGEVFRVAFPNESQPAKPSTVDGQGNVPTLDEEMLAAASGPIPEGPYPQVTPGPPAPWLPRTDPSPGGISGTQAPSPWDVRTPSSGP